MEVNLFDVINSLSYKYECFHLTTLNLDIMGQSPIYNYGNKATNEFMWVFLIEDNTIRLLHCMAGFENDHYDCIIIPLPVDGYPPDKPDYTFTVQEGEEYEEAELLIIKHANTEEKLICIEFFN